MKELNISQFLEKKEKGFEVLDLRPPKDFEEGFIPGSFYLDPNDENYPVLKEQILDPHDHWIAIVGDDDYNEPEKELEIEGILKYGMSSWLKSGLQKDMLIAIDPEEFILDLKHDKNIHLMDFRNPDDFSKSHVEFASNYLLNHLALLLTELDPLDKYYLLSDSYSTSLSIASFFNRYGISRIRILKGKYDEIRHSDLPIIEKKVKKSNSN